MILEKFYKTYLEGKEEINYFLDSILELVLVDEIKDRKNYYKESLLKFLFYNNNDFIYELKYDIFQYVNSEYLEKVFHNLQKKNYRWVKTLWQQGLDKEETLKVITILGNKKIEILKNVIFPTFKSFENDIKNGEIIQNILNSILENMQQIQKNQNMMLANISHEMRTPLNSVIGFLDVLEKEIKNSESRKKISYAKNSAKVLLNLINDLLDTQKLSTAKIDITTNPFWVNKIIKNAVLISTINANQKNVQLIYKDNLTIFTEVLGDKNRFLQILNNLLSNAVKFTPSGGKVEISAISEDLGDKVKIFVKVQDTGIGIPKEKQKELFKPFSRATDKEKGTGLGLYISKQLAMKMGGDIWFESEEGKGTTFYLEIPFKKHEISYNKEVLEGKKIAILVNSNDNFYCDNLKAQIESAGGEVKIFKSVDSFMKFLLYNKKIDMSIIVYPNEFEKDELDSSFIKTFKTLNFSKHFFIAGLEEGYYPKNGELFDKVIESPITLIDILEIFSTPNIIKQNHKFLIIDDEPLNRKVLASMLKIYDKEAEIDMAVDGDEGLEKLKKQSYDLVFLDKRMPKMNGYEVLKKLKELGIKTNVYLLTADGDSDTIKTAEEYNAGYISKPVSLSTIQSVLAKLSNRGGGVEPLKIGL